MNSLNFSAKATYEALKNTGKINQGLDIVFETISDSPRALISHFSFLFKISSSETCVQETLSSTLITERLETGCISTPEIISFFVSDKNLPSMKSCIAFLNNTERKFTFNGRWRLRSIILHKHKYFTSAVYRKKKWILKSYGEDIQIHSWSNLIKKCFELNLRPQVLLYASMTKKNK